MADLRTALHRTLPGGALHLLFAALSAAALSGCASLNLGGAAGLRSVDYLHDDVAAMLLAFDLPVVLEPLPGGSTLRLDVVSDGTERHLAAVLVRSEADDLAGTLPPPSPGRTYYLLGFSPADQAALRDLQAWAASAATPVSVAVDFRPGLCASAAADPAKTTISVLLALPDAHGLTPLIDRQSIVGAAGSGSLPTCT